MPQVNSTVLVVGVALVVIGVTGLFLMVMVGVDGIGHWLRNRRDEHHQNGAYDRAGREAMHWPTDVGGGWS